MENNNFRKRKEKNSMKNENPHAVATAINKKK
jgi:hypothetical protein